jgi:hypothetical protein
MIRYPVQIYSAQKLGTLLCVQSFNCFGLESALFPVVLYDLPTASRIDGIIGMDFLSKNRILIATGEAEIYIPI